MEDLHPNSSTMMVAEDMMGVVTAVAEDMMGVVTAEAVVTAVVTAVVAAVTAVAVEVTDHTQLYLSDERREQVTSHFARLMSNLKQGIQKGVFVEMHVDTIEDYRCRKHEE